ncbi:DMT family transporter [Alkalicoccus saliphilus]|uniref:EamA family transporter n=1 Tax=Alkalicoccus saliphilus TaxID=200989 RepID=A0A2T4U810_9BACI|nr:DMT family transporter [Alkalicoccus saliphilus]PTL39543.1 EamA family transporter [Alkalicoccus saliphilus]
MNKTFTYLLLLLVMFIWGLNVVAVKFLVEHMEPVQMQGLRIGVAGIAAMAAVLLLKETSRLSRREWKIIVSAALFGQVGHHAFLAVGLTETTAANGSLILGLIPLTTALLAVIFLGDPLTRWRFAGIILGFLGIVFIILNPEEGVSSASRGDLFVFLSMLSQAVSFILIKQASVTVSPRWLTALMLLIGSVSLLMLSFYIEPSFGGFAGYSVLVLSVFFGSAILATGMGHLLFNAAIQKIGPGQSALFNNFVPFFALLGSYFLLGETIYSSQIIGFIFIVTGVLLGTGYMEQVILKKKYS